MALYINEVEDEDRSLSSKNKRPFTLNHLQGHLSESYGEVRFLGKETEHDDEFIYIFGDSFSDDFFPMATASGLTDNIAQDYVEGYAFFSDFFQMGLEDMTFLDIEASHFDIAEIYMQLTNDDDPDKPPFHTKLSIVYQYKNYFITLIIEGPHPTKSHDSLPKWKDGDLTYRLKGEVKNPKNEDTKISPEDYEAFRDLITRQVTDE